MKLVRLNSVFDIIYGHSLELNKLIPDSHGVNFVSRTSKNNGVSSRVAVVDNINPHPSGGITVALGGSVLESFLQSSSFYTGYHVFCLYPHEPMTTAEKLYYCECIKLNRYRYNYGRQANKSLPDLHIPERNSFPYWVRDITDGISEIFSTPASDIKYSLTDTRGWGQFRYSDLFVISRGKGPRKNALDGCGNTPFITSTDSDNGLSGYTNVASCHPGNVITVNRNGSVGEAFYQPQPFCSTEDVHIFEPRFYLDPFVAMFIITLIKKECFRFGYGRKWGLERMNNSLIRLPVLSSGEPDWEYMRNFIKGLSFSSLLSG